MSAWPKWLNHDRHPANVAELAEGETAMAVCAPHGNPKLSKRCADFPEGRALVSAMVETARQFYMTAEEPRRSI